MDRNTRANSSAPSTRPNPSPEGSMRLARTCGHAGVPASGVGRMRHEVDSQNPANDTNSQGPEHGNLRINDVVLRLPVAETPSNIGYTPGVDTAAPGSLVQAQQIQIPLPVDTDPDFKIDIIAPGRVGYNLRATPGNKDHVRVAPSVEQYVNNATMPLEHILQDNGLYVQRVHYALEKNQVVPKLKSLDPQRQYAFTLGHLITMLQVMQSGNWYHTMKGHPDKLTLRYVTGTDSTLPRSVPRSNGRTCGLPRYGGACCQKSDGGVISSSWKFGCNLRPTLRLRAVRNFNCALSVRLVDIL